MKKVFISGATGNIGTALINYLLKEEVQVIAGVRDINKASSSFPISRNLQFRHFDFENLCHPENTLEGVDIVFLLRPPHISDVQKYFVPIIDSIQKAGIKKVVFLSVQGVEQSSVIPHHKIEKLIVDSGLEYIFVRPSYFMQNLSTTFIHEIKNNHSLTVPAGNGVFNWIDVDNIGEACMQLILGFDQFKNRGYDITGLENKTFAQACDELTKVIGTKIRFISPNLISFYRLKREEGMIKGFILVMIMLHFLPRIQKAPKISNNYTMLTGKEPTLLSHFFTNEKQLFIGE